MNKLKRFYYMSRYPLFLWCLASFACSAMKAFEPHNDTSNCGKTYPIDYIVYTNLFCEIKQ